MAAKATKKGDKALENGDYPVAEKHFNKAIARLFARRSQARGSIGRTYAALSDAEMAVELFPTWAKGYGHLAAAHLRLGDRQLAIKSYRDGLEIDPENSTLRSGLASVRTPRQIRRAVRRYNNNDLSEQPGNDCWAVTTSNLLKMMARTLYNEEIEPDMSEFQQTFDEGSDDSCTCVELHRVMNFAKENGIPTGPDRRIYPIVEVIDVSDDKYDSKMIQSHMEEHGVLLVSFPVNEAFCAQRPGCRDVQDLTHLQEEILKYRMKEIKGRLTSDDYKYLEEAETKEKRIIKKNERYTVNHTAILCGKDEDGDAWLVRCCFEDKFGHRNIVKLKVIFDEIIVVKWRDPDSPNLWTFY